MSEIVIQGTTPGIRVSGTGAQVTVKVTTGSGGGGGVVTDHNALTGRSDPDQHPVSAVTGLQDALNNKASSTDPRLSDARTPTAHKASHATGGTDPLTAADIGAAPVSHAHAAADVTSGVIAPARLGTGTADSTTVLHGDGTWVAAGGNDWAVSAPPTSSNFQGTGRYNVTQALWVGVGTMLLVPFKMLPFSYTAMVIRVVVGGGAGEIVRLGVYERLDDGSCGGLLVDAGTVTVNSGGMKTATMPPFTPSDPNVYLAFVTQGPTKTATFYVHNNNAPVLSTGLMFNNFENQGLFAVTGVTGALPADPTATVVMGFGVPIIGLY